MYGKALSPAWWHKRIPEWKAEQGLPEDPGKPFTRAAAAELSNLQARSRGCGGLAAHCSKRHLADQAWHFPFLLYTPTLGWGTEASLV